MTATWLLPATLAVAGIGFSVSTYLRYLTSREDLRERRIRLEMEYRKQEVREAVPRGRDLRDLRAQLNEQTRLIERLVSRDIIVNVGRERTPGPVDDESRTAPASNAAALVVREISHSLNTPLSQIEIALALLASNSNLSGEDSDAIARATTSVAVSKAFIQAFRLVSGGEMAPVEGAEPNLAELVSRAASVVGASLDMVDVRLPADVGYRPPFILALLLPLIENAVEASREGDTVQVWSDSVEKAVALNVRNAVAEGLSEDIFTPGFSSKPNHEGLGLAVVSRLVRSVPGASLRQHVMDGAVTFTILLPIDVPSEAVS